MQADKDRIRDFDQRIVDRHIDLEVSVGDYVLSGGEIPAMVMVDAVTRLIPGVLGDRESAENDSFYNGLLEPPVYTRPEEFEGIRVPAVLLSGHHENIARWRRKASEETTRALRPDLWNEYERLRRNSGRSGREPDNYSE